MLIISNIYDHDDQHCTYRPYMVVADHKAKQGRLGLSVLDLLPHNITIVIITIATPFVIIINLIIIILITAARLL